MFGNCVTERSKSIKTTQIVSSFNKVLLKDIANKANVSTALVSFVLNGNGRKYRVSDETAKHILKIAREMNYQPNQAAKSLRSGKTTTIGVAVSDISNTFFAQVARSIEDVAGRMGYTVFFGSSDENAPKLDALVSGLINRGVDGLIVVPCEKSEATIERVVDMDVPLVLFDRPCRSKDISSVSLNNFEAGYKATDHLIKSGYTHAGMVAYNVDLSHMQDRIRGYKTAMTDNGLTDNINIGYLNPAAPRKSTAKVLSKMMLKNVDALFMATNTISIACLYYLSDNRIAVPDTLAIVGFDGNDAFELYNCPITYVRQPVEALAQKAVEVVVESINNRSAAVQKIHIESDLVVNGSSAPKPNGESPQKE